MSFAELWAKDFIAEYKLQKIDDWWNKLAKPSDKSWTSRIAELLRCLAQKKGFHMEYEISADFSWYKGESTHPSVAIEHENTFSADIYKEELPKLLASGAQLKVLITYPKHMKEESELVNRIQGSLSKPKREQKTRLATEEFLLLLGEPEGSHANWRSYIFSSDGKLKRNGRKTVKITDSL